MTFEDLARIELAARMAFVPDEDALQDASAQTSPFRADIGAMQSSYDRSVSFTSTGKKSKRDTSLKAAA